jgi:hypothetical protein
MPEIGDARLCLDETALCRLFVGEVLQLSVAVGRTGFTRGEERLRLEICLGEKTEALRQIFWATLTAANREKTRAGTDE